MLAQMLLASTPAPDLETKLAALLNSADVGKIFFVVANEKDKDFPHRIQIDGQFYARISQKLGGVGRVTIVVDPTQESYAVTKFGSMYRRQIVVRSNDFTKLELQAGLVHEITHAGLDLDRKRLCSDKSCKGVKESENLYWALGEAITYVAEATFLQINGVVGYGRDDQLGNKAYDMAKKAESAPEHVVADKDIREFIALIRNHPGYQANSGSRNDYWDAPHKGQPAGKKPPAGKTK